MAIIDPKIELNKDLSLVRLTNGENNLCRTGQDNTNSLPGQARTSLDNAPLKKYLREALLTPNLDKMAPYFWLVRVISNLMGCIITIILGVHARLRSHLRPPLPSCSRTQRYRYRKCLSPPCVALQPNIHQTPPPIYPLIRVLGIRRENRRRALASGGWLCANIFLPDKIRNRLSESAEHGTGADTGQRRKKSHYV